MEMATNGINYIENSVQIKEKKIITKIDINCAYIWENTHSDSIGVVRKDLYSQ